MKMNHSLFLFFTVLFIICLLLYVFDQGKQTIVKKKKKSLTTSQAYDGTAFYFKIQSMREGVPMIKINVNNNRLIVIFDTGSSALNVAGSNCKSCFKGHGSYNLKNNNLLTNTQRIEYGSQIDDVIQTKDTLILDLPNNKKRRIDVPLFVTVKRQSGENGSSNNNVLGGMLRYNSVSSYMLPENYKLVIDLKSENRYIAGFSNLKVKAMIDDLMSNSVQLNRIQLIHSVSLPYYVCRVHGIASGVYSSKQITKAIIDTGSNYMSLPPKVYDNVMKQINKSLRPSLTIQFSDNVSMRFDSSNLMWQNSADAMIDDDTDALSSQFYKNTMIIGCHALQGRLLFFDKDEFAFTTK